ncbi:MAG: LysM peptidoglycan-binding domain-containing protein [Akkermansia sp.]|nr:LysM peptidoglycan-binding domain-containing protein [Akkermansia sp.]
MLVAGHKIRIPLPADSQEAKALAATREAERVEKEGLDYTIKSGDTLSKLQRKFGTTVAAIQKLNQMGNSTNLRVGQKIKIPATEKAKKALGK